jgi:hypothetical protein
MAAHPTIRRRTIRPQPPRQTLRQQKEDRPNLHLNRPQPVTSIQPGTKTIRHTDPSRIPAQCAIHKKNCHKRVFLRMADLKKRLKLRVQNSIPKKSHSIQLKTMFSQFFLQRLLNLFAETGKTDGVEVFAIVQTLQAGTDSYLAG